MHLKLTGPKTAVFCSTEEIAQKVTGMAKAAGLKKSNGKEWDEEPTPGGLAYDLHGGNFAEKRTYQGQGYEVVSSIQFLAVNNSQ